VRPAVKHQTGKLPDGVDARYLLGIVKNLDHLHQAKPITEALILAAANADAGDRLAQPRAAEKHVELGATTEDS
jgi:hypothetical protein